MSLKKVVDYIKRNKSFLITSHTNLEGDALGSELAFYLLLKKIGKRATIINEDDLPYGYSFLPGNNNIRRFKGSIKNLDTFAAPKPHPSGRGKVVPLSINPQGNLGIQPEVIRRIDFDCFVTLDCSDLKRTGEVWRLNAKLLRPVINIDHHISNQRFGAVNWVDAHSSSCSEMIYRLYKRLAIPFDKDIATLLYVGILTDSGSFRYSNTTSSTHKAVSELLKYNLDIPQIYKNVYENIPFLDMKLLSKICLEIKRLAKGRIIWFQLKHNLLKNKKLSFDLSEHILSFGRAIKDAEVVVLFKENLGAKDEIRVNLRSQGAVDVNKIAQGFGGGGHKAASGITIKGKIDEVRRMVLVKIKENLR